MTKGYIQERKWESSPFQWRGLAMSFRHTKYGRGRGIKMQLYIC